MYIRCPGVLNNLELYFLKHNGSLPVTSSFFPEEIFLEEIGVPEITLEVLADKQDFRPKG